MLLLLPGLPMPAEGGLREGCECASGVRLLLVGGVRPAERRPEEGRAPSAPCCGLLARTGLQQQQGSQRVGEVEVCVQMVRRGVW